MIQLGEFANHVDADFNLLVGTAGALFGGLALSCAGGVLALANVAPQNCVEIYQLVEEGNFEADAGGSNGYRPHMWKVKLQEIRCNKYGFKAEVKSHDRIARIQVN